MVKTVTSISIEIELMDKFKASHGERANFSDYISKLVSDDLNQNVSLSELERKIQDTEETLVYLNDKYEELLKFQTQSIEFEARNEQEKLENKIKAKEERIQKVVTDLSAIPELAPVIEEARSNPSLITNSKWLFEKLDFVRQIQPNARFGIVQLRTFLSKSVQ